MNPQKNKPDRKAISQRVAGKGGLPQAAPALSSEVTVTRPLPKPFPLMANLLNTQKLSLKAQAPRSRPQCPRPARGSLPSRGT